MNYLGDLFALTTFDGKTQFLPQGDLHLPAYGNFGAPPTQWITARGYRQHGATFRDYLLEPRTITLELYQRGGCDRQAYWDSRAKLLDLLRPNRGGPLTFTVRTPNGAKRSLFVRPDPGLQLPPSPPEQNDWSVREAVDFVAFDPIWFDPTPVSETSAGVVANHLVFPATFPIQFGLFGLRFAFGQNYRGTWASWPTFVIEGPYNLATFINHVTGARFQLMLPIADGDTRTIDLTPGEQRIVDGAGTTRFGELAPDSNIVDFSLQPPGVAAPAQQIDVILSGASPSSRVTLSYYERYYGI